MAAQGTPGTRPLDVVVVGSSVAGAVAALLLARHGIPVRVLERRVGPHDKVCGEGILPMGRSLLEPIVGPLGGTPFAGLTFRSAGSADLVWGFPGARAGVAVERRVLDFLQGGV